MPRNKQTSIKAVLSLIVLISVLVAPSASTIAGIDEQKLAQLKQKYGKVYASAQRRGWSHAQSTDPAPPLDPYDHKVTYYSGSKDDGTGRFEVNLLSVDPDAARAAKTENGSSDSMLSKFWRGMVKVLAKFFVVIFSLVLLFLYSLAFYFLIWKKGMYDELWQGMANQYQELPEDRLNKKNLKKEYLNFWNKFSFRCPKIGTVNGLWLNTMYKIKKYEGQMNPQEYLFDSHMYEIEGRYRMKQRPILDYDAIKKISKKYNSLMLEPFYSLHYPDKIFDAKELRVRNMINGLGDSEKKAAGTPLCYLKPDELKIVKDFIRREIAYRNAVYYPFIINLPLKLQQHEKIFVEGRRNKRGHPEEIDRHWFYYEIEILSRIGADTSFVLGLLPEPKDDAVDVNNVADFVYPEEANSTTEIQKIHPPADAPDWVRDSLFNIKPGDRYVSADKKYIEGWKNIVPGDVQNSIGFDISSGKVKVSGGLTYAIDMDTWMQQIHQPRTLWKATEPRKNIAEREKENVQRRLLEEDDEGKTYVGDSFGLAYNAHSGYVFLTYNGMVINKAADEINTKINMAILEKFDEEEKAFNLAEAELEQKKMNTEPKYFKTLKLDANVKREIDIRNLIKIDTGNIYIPCIYTDQNTRFRINMGATAFRSTQPEFQAGLLFNSDTDHAKAYLKRDEKEIDRLDFEEEPAY